MDQDQPPPLPVEPLNYASNPVRYGPQNSNSHSHKAARFSWRAPLVVIVLGICTGAMRAENPYLATTVAWINTSLLFGGFAAGLAALFGVRRHGSGILAPALIGTVLNGVILFFVLSYFVLAARPSTAAGPAMPAGSALPPPLTSQQSEDSAEKYPGWVGAVGADGLQITVISIAGESPLGVDTLRMLPGHYQMLVLSFDARASQTPRTIDVTTATIQMSDGTTRTPLDTIKVFRASPDPKLAASAMTVCPTTLQISAVSQRPDSTTLFVPSEIDLHSVASITFNIDGTAVVVPGRVLSVDEKQENIRRSKAHWN